MSPLLQPILSSDLSCQLLFAGLSTRWLLDAIIEDSRCDLTCILMFLVQLPAIHQEY